MQQVEERNFGHHVEKLNRHVTALQSSILSQIYSDFQEESNNNNNSNLFNLNLEEILEQYPELSEKYEKRIKNYLSMKRKLQRLK